MVTIEKKNRISSEEWTSIPRDVIGSFRAHFVKEESGGFTAFAAYLPGVVSDGETFDEALENITDAFGLVIESYKELEMPIPWVRVGLEEELFASRLIRVDF